MAISPYQKVTLSPQFRTAACCNDAGEHSFISSPGEYTFFTFTLKNYAEVTFEKDPDTLKNIEFVELELQYGSKVIGESLDITANEIKIHPGATLTLKGYEAETGPGSGNMVCSEVTFEVSSEFGIILINVICTFKTFRCVRCSPRPHIAETKYFLWQNV